MAYNRKEEYLAVVKQPKEISNTLLETIDYIAQQRDAELSFDKTIIAEIVSLNNADTGEYFVEYQKGKFRAYTPTNLNYTYSKGTNVYVKIPGGDFTQKKIIEGKVSASSYSAEEYETLAQQVIDMGDIYTNNNEYSILAYASEGTKYYEQVIYENKDLKEDLVFTSLLNTYPNIKISADFRTQFYGSMVAGNYGLKIEFQEKDTGVIFTRRLDITNFSGSIYNYEIYAPQYAIYDLSNINLLGIKKITFFQERFIRYDTVFNAYNEPIKVYDKEPNIFVNNIKINFVDIQDTAKDLYYVGISAPQGLSLIQDTDKIKLTGVFYYAGKDIMDKKNCVCHWYKQNPSILSGSEKYDKLAGPGWECIDENNNVNFNEIIISGKDVYQQMRYKLVVIYNSSVTLYKDVRVVKYYNERFTIIRKDISDKEVKLTITDSQSKVETADWYVDLLDGSYLALETNVNEIDISKYLEYGNIIFYTVSKIDDKNYVPCEYKLVSYIQDMPVRVVFDGNDTFQYDVNGSITYDQSVAEIIIKPTITVDKENIGIKTATWYSPDGAELLEYPTTKITNSMISKLWIDKATNSVHYNIRQKYLANYTNNTLSLKIITLADKEFYFTKTIIFTKQGEYEVNGQDYSLIVKQCAEDGSEVKTQPLNRKNTKEEYTPIYFKPELRLDGELIKNGTSYKDEDGNILSSYKITVKSKDINITSELINTEKNIYKITNAIDNCDGQYFIKFTISIGLSGNQVEEQFLHYYQPIMVSQGIDNEKIGTITIPSKITYDASGTPSYSSSKAISFTYKSLNKIETELIGRTTKSLTSNILIYPISYGSGKGGYYLRPTDNYTGAYFAGATDDVKTTPMGALQIFVSKRNYIIYPIVMLTSKDSNITNKDDDGTNITTVDDENEEKTSPLDPVFSFGNKNGSNTLGNIVKKYSSNTKTINEDEVSIPGLFQYDTDGIPTNVLRSDGFVRLGGNSVVIKDGTVKVNDADILTTESIIAWIKAHKNEVKQMLEL